MSQKSESFADNWPTPANSISTYITELCFGEHFSKSAELSKQCKSRGAFNEFSRKAHAIYEKSEQSIGQLKFIISGYLAEIAGFQQELQLLNNNEDVVTIDEQNTSSIPESIQLPMPKFDLPMESIGKPWKTNKKFPHSVSINFVAADATNLFVFADNQLFHTLLGAAVLPIAKSRSELFSSVKLVRCMPKTTTLIFTTTDNTKEFVIFDFQRQSNPQKVDVVAEIRSIDCNETKIAITITDGKTLLYSYVGAKCRKLHEFEGCAGLAAARITEVDILAYIDADGVLTFYDVNQNSALPFDSTYSRPARSLTSAGPLMVIDFNANEVLYYNIRNRSSYLHSHEVDYGRLLTPFSGDNRHILFAKNGACYTIGTFKFDPQNGLAFDFAFQFNANALEESFAFLKIDWCQHLQFVSNDGCLVRYKIDPGSKRWIRVKDNSFLGLF